MCLNEFIEGEKIKERIKGARDTRRKENQYLCATEGPMAGENLRRGARCRDCNVLLLQVSLG